MATIRQLRYLLSQLKQQRYYLEKHIERIPKMLAACLILRYRKRSSREFESPRKVKRSADVKSYAYLTFLEAGENRHRYVPHKKIGEIAQLTEAYKVYCRKMQRIRQLNKRVVEILNQIADLQTKEVHEYVSTPGKRTARNDTKRRTKQRSTRADKRR